MFLLRDVQRADLSHLKKLAAALNTVNLPDNQAMLEELIERSVKSFTGKIEDPFAREYVFVLEDTRTGKLLGTSMAIAQHGHHESPHIYMDVAQREHYSSTVDLHIRHKVLSIAFNYDGPTEIGGLVVDPAARHSPEKLGKQLSYVRFLYIAMHRRCFRDRVLAELLPPLLPDGRSLLWEACGKTFTHMSYSEADRLSRQNKEFIKELFPPTGIYVSLFPERVQKVIGEVGKNAKGVQRMLERIGFSYSHHVDPFDGGPHFEADTDAVTLVRTHRSVKVVSKPGPGTDQDLLVGHDRPKGRTRFVALRCRARLSSGGIWLPPEAQRALDVVPGAKVFFIPFE